MKFESACSTLESLLSGSARADMVAEVSKAKNFAASMTKLREIFRGNKFPGGQLVKALEKQARADGFDVLHDWDGVADHPNEEIIPVDVLNYLLTLRIQHPQHTLAVLIDYYFFYVCSLLALRAWDEGDANANLDRVSAMLGNRFVRNAEAAIFVATSHFEPDHDAYVRLLAKIRTLDDRHQMTFALLNASILSCHLRFGFEPFYRKDIGAMRNDNAPDYVWLNWSLLTLMRAYDVNERGAVVEGILCGLAPDTRAFVGKRDDGEFRELFEKHRASLLKDFEDYRPSPERYAPLAFSFNFPHNILKGVVVDEALRGETWTVTLNDLLSGGGIGSEDLARTLMAYATANPEKKKGRQFPIITYDTFAGIRAYNKTLSLIREAGREMADGGLRMAD